MTLAAHKLIAVLILLACTTQAFAQATTQPAAAVPADWPTIADRFATALVNGDAVGARAMGADVLQVARAGPANEAASLLAVIERSAGGAVLASHAYAFPPLALAADLAADFKTSPAIADDLKQLMAPTDDDAMQRANATAIQWVAHALDAQKGTPIAVAVLLPPASEGSDKAPVPVLLLMKGAPEPDGTFRVTRVVFGTPNQIIE